MNLGKPSVLLANQTLSTTILLILLIEITSSNEGSFQLKLIKLVTVDVSGVNYETL